jgi:hypothetical protein
MQTQQKVTFPTVLSLFLKHSIYSVNKLAITESVHQMERSYENEEVLLRVNGKSYGIHTVKKWER